MKELSLQEIQQVELEILKKFDKICRENDLKYYLCYGTLIGAIRHHGFIPWDDDIDVVMPRDHYERFLQLCKKEPNVIFPYKCGNYLFDRKFPYPITRLCDNRYFVNYENRQEHDFGLFLDIYPLDGCGNTREESLNIYKSTLTDFSILSSASRKIFEKSPNGTIRNVLKFLLFHYTRIFGTKFFMDRMNTRSKSHSFYESKYVSCTNWCIAPKYIHERECFDEQIEVQFEGGNYYAPKDYDALLTGSYGDYMTPPPSSEQIAHHYYKAYLKEN